MERSREEIPLQPRKVQSAKSISSDSSVSIDSRNDEEERKGESSESQLLQEPGAQEEVKLI